MSTEKTPVLLPNKTPREEGDVDDLRQRYSKYALSWILLVILFTLMLILTLQFWWWPFEKKLELWEDEESTEVTRLPRIIEIITTTTKNNEVVSPGPWDFEFLIDPPDLCATRNSPNSPEYGNDPEVKLLMLVPSAVDHFEQRRAIRNTWGSLAEKPFGPMRLGFVLGTTNNRTLEYLILEESSRNRDIIQADFVDSYHHLTTKSILMLKWVAKRCPHAQYFLKADDDTFVNIEKIARILSNEPYINNDKFISGNVQKGVQPSRNPQTEAYVPSLYDYRFPEDEEYPPYVSGSAYVMTIPTALDLFEASKEVAPLLPQEDVYLTGYCAKSKEVPLIHESSFVIDDPPNPPSWKTFSPLTIAHSVSPASLEQVWDEMTRSVINSLFNMESAMNTTVRLRLKRDLN